MCSPLSILSARSVACSRFHTERPQVLGVITQHVDVRTAWFPVPVHSFPEDGSWVLTETCYKFLKWYLKVVCAQRWCFLRSSTGGSPPGATINQFKVCTESTVALFITSTDGVNHNETDVWRLTQKKNSHLLQHTWQWAAADLRPVLKRPGREASQWPPSIVLVNNEWISTSTSPTCAYGEHRDNFTFILHLSPMPVNCEQPALPAL